MADKEELEESSRSRILELRSISDNIKQMYVQHLLGRIPVQKDKDITESSKEVSVLLLGRVICCCLTPIQQFFKFSAISWREQVNFQLNDDEVHFVLDQHAELDFYSASSLKQQSAGRHVTPLGHSILIPSQQVFALTLNVALQSDFFHSNHISANT